MALTIENGVIPQPLRDTILEGRCTVFIGSGPSARIYGLWDAVVNQLCESCGLDTRVGSASSAEELLTAAQEARTANAVAYHQFLGSHFGRPVDSAPLIYDVLLQLPFAAYLTVNLDPTLAMRANGLSARLPVHTYPNLDRRQMAERSVHYLHGLIVEHAIPTTGTVVFAQGEFDQAYHDNSALMSLLTQTLDNDQLVFIGCRLREPPFSRIFRICKEHQRERLRLIAESGQPRSEPPERYIVLAKPTAIDYRGVGSEERSRAEMQQQQEYYESLDVQPVWYDTDGDDHTSLRMVFERLARLPALSPQHGWEVNADVE